MPHFVEGTFFGFKKANELNLFYHKTTLLMLGIYIFKEHGNIAINSYLNLCSYVTA